MCLRICSCQEEIVQPHTTKVAEEGMTINFKAKDVIITASVSIFYHCHQFYFNWEEVCLEIPFNHLRNLHPSNRFNYALCLFRFTSIICASVLVPTSLHLSLTTSFDAGDSSLGSI